MHSFLNTVQSAKLIPTDTSKINMHQVIGDNATPKEGADQEMSEEFSHFFSTILAKTEQAIPESNGPTNPSRYEVTADGVTTDTLSKVEKSSLPSEAHPKDREKHSQIVPLPQHAEPKQFRVSLDAAPAILQTRQSVPAIANTLPNAVVTSFIEQPGQLHKATLPENEIPQSMSKVDGGHSAPSAKKASPDHIASNHQAVDVVRPQLRTEAPSMNGLTQAQTDTMGLQKADDSKFVSAGKAQPPELPAVHKPQPTIVPSDIMPQKRIPATVAQSKYTSERNAITTPSPQETRAVTPHALNSQPTLTPTLWQAPPPSNHSKVAQDTPRIRKSTGPQRPVTVSVSAPVRKHTSPTAPTQIITATAEVEKQGMSSSLFDIDPLSIASTEATIRTSAIQPNTVPIRANLSSHIARQIADAVQVAPNKPLEITLNPEELGRVRLSLNVSENSVVLNILAERPETSDLMRRHISALESAFENLGYDEISFSFGGEANAETDDDHHPSEKGHTQQMQPDDPNPSKIQIDLSAAPTAGIDIRL